MARLRLLIGDDHTLVRQGLRRILEERPGWEVVAEAGDGREAVRLALEQKPDVAVMDISMPQLNGIEAARQLHKRLPEARVLILSMHAEQAYVTRALQAGARGYLLKDSAGQDLIRAVELVADGRTFFSPSIVQLIVDDYIRRVTSSEPSDRYAQLSDREREILQLVAEGRSNKEVAEALGISLATVETHRARLLQKLDLHNTAELVRYAVRHGVIS